MEIIRIKNLNLYVGKKQILKNINFNIQNGDFVTILGKNGNGKTSIFKAIMSHYDYEKNGTILFKNVDITNFEPNEIASLGIWYVPQISSEIKGLKVYDFLRIVLEKKFKLSDNKFFSKLNEVLTKLQLSPDVLNRDVNVGFSGGEKKKLELLQLIMIEPELILLDEIDSGLDYEAIEILINVLLDFKKEGKTVIIITHNPNFLERLAINMEIHLKNGSIDHFVSLKSSKNEH